LYRNNEIKKKNLETRFENEVHCEEEDPGSKIQNQIAGKEEEPSSRSSCKAAAAAKEKNA